MMAILFVRGKSPVGQSVERIEADAMQVGKTGLFASFEPLQCGLFRQQLFPDE
jgi:hypothetical protein